MQKVDSEIVYSPTDLTTFVDSPFASWMTRCGLEQPDRLPRADVPDALMTLLAERGITHEQTHLAKLHAAGQCVCEIPVKGTPQARAEATLRAMQEGVDIIYQAFLVLPPFAGIADFLVKTPGRSALGEWHYVVWDTKLSTTVKPAYLLQMCCYAEMLEALQLRLPDTLTVALGNGENVTFNTADYFYYYQSIKTVFLGTQSSFDSTRQPDPADSNGFGRWSDHAGQLLIARDHLIQVANIRKTQINKLNVAGVMTMSDLARLPTGVDIKGINPQALGKLRAQAAIQLKSKEKDTPDFEILTPEGQGLTLLPPSSAQDIFFDIEGFPLDKGGLEYLWGSTYFDDAGARQFIDFWAHTPEQEKKCFTDFIGWAYTRWLRDPQMHIYHYASYEITACKKLIKHHGVCEFEFDQLLRHGVFIDLYKVIRGCLLLGEPRYSIKNVEHLYRQKRSTDVANGGDSVVAYEAWRVQFALDHPGQVPPQTAWETYRSLADIRAYNKDDCDSTQELVDWLRVQQQAKGITYGAMADKDADKKELEKKTTRDEGPSQLYLDLRAQATQDKAACGADGAAGNTIPVTETLAWLLDFHRRENKPVFWRKFDRLASTEDELFDDLDCIAGCESTERTPFKYRPRDHNLCYEYRFDPNQECKGQADSYFMLGASEKPVTVLDIDFAAGTLLVKAKSEPPERITLIPDELIPTDPIPGAIARAAQEYLNDREGNSALIDFLHRRPPRIDGIVAGQPIISAPSGEARLQEIIAAIAGLQHSCLTIQGPPGTGKTYTASHVIAELMRRGKKVGISSNSHKAINNLLIRTAEVCRREGIDATFTCNKNTDDALFALDVAIITNSYLFERIQPACVIGSTAWGFCREDLDKQFDYLFVDEAGQVSIANLVGMSRAADNIVLIGDQMQLSQPTQGLHPGDSGKSTLDYFMGEQATIAEQAGIFLNTTSRMHPAINRFISDAIYDGRLLTDPDNERQAILVPENYQGDLNCAAGIVIKQVRHQGNSQASEEEAETIAQFAAECLTRTLVDKKGASRQLCWNDMLFVAPYNFQVNKLRAHLSRLPGGDKAHVGTVDRFQGQEAAIVFISMCSSDANEAPRGMDFLFDEHRLNVAVSRARSLAVVVMHPDLVTTTVTTPAQMKKVNLLARLCAGIAY
jgi:predicted RecB family nuclease